MAMRVDAQRLCPRLVDYVVFVGCPVRRSQTLAQTPQLLRRYPMQEHKDFIMPPDLVVFCQPEGCIAVERRHLSLRDNTTFVFTLTDKDSAKVRYGICLNFYRRASYTDEVSGKTRQLFCLTSLCIITHHLFISNLRELLFVLKRMIDTGSKRCLQSGKARANDLWSFLTGETCASECSSQLLNTVRHIETWILRLLSAPAPIPGALRVDLYADESDRAKCMQLAYPDGTRLGLVDFPLHLPLELLGVDSCLKVLSCILLEQKVIIQSRDYNALTMSVLALVAMLYPLEYMFPVIPLLPTCLNGAEHLLLSPTPYIIGIPSSFLLYKRNFQLPQDVWLVDLDTNKIVGMDSALPPLPEPEGTILKRHLKQAFASMSFAPIKDINAFLQQQEEPLEAQRSAAQSSNSQAVSGNLSVAKQEENVDLMRSQNMLIYGNDVDSIDVATRVAMVKFFSSPNLLANFAEHTRIIRFHPRPVVAFQFLSFIKSRPNRSIFTSRLARTQAIEYFAEWSLSSDNVAYLRIQTGVYDPRLIGDKPKWFVHTLEALEFRVVDPPPSTNPFLLAENGQSKLDAQVLAERHEPDETEIDNENDNENDDLGEIDGAPFGDSSFGSMIRSSSSYSSLGEFVTDLLSSEINLEQNGSAERQRNPQVLLVDAALCQPPVQLLRDSEYTRRRALDAGTFGGENQNQFEDSSGTESSSSGDDDDKSVDKDKLADPDPDCDSAVTFVEPVTPSDHRLMRISESETDESRSRHESTSESIGKSKPPRPPPPRADSLKQHSAHRPAAPQRSEGTNILNKSSVAIKSDEMFKAALSKIEKTIDSKFGDVEIGDVQQSAKLLLKQAQSGLVEATHQFTAEAKANLSGFMPDFNVTEKVVTDTLRASGRARASTEPEMPLQPPKPAQPVPAPVPVRAPAPAQSQERRASLSRLQQRFVLKAQASIDKHSKQLLTGLRRRSREAVADVADVSIENQTFLHEILDGVLDGQQISFMKVNRVKKLMEDEKYRSFLLVKLLNAPKCSSMQQSTPKPPPQRSNSDDAPLEDVFVSRSVFKSVLQLLKLVAQGIEFTYTQQGGSGGLASSFLALQIAHTFFWQQASAGQQIIAASALLSPESADSNGRLASSDSQRKTSSLRGSKESLDNRASANVSEDLGNLLTTMSGWWSSMTKKPAAKAIDHSPSANVPTLHYPATVAQNNGRPPQLASQTANSTQVRSVPVPPAIAIPASNAPAQPNSTLTVSTNSSNSPSEASSDDLASINFRNSELQPANGVTVTQQNWNASELGKSRYNRGYRFTGSRLIRAVYPLSVGISRAYLFEMLLGKDRSKLWDQLQFWEDTFLDAVSYTREIIGMDQDYAEMKERYLSMNQAQRKLLELQEDQLLGTLLHNLIAFMLMTQVNKEEIRRKVRRLLGKCHVGLRYGQCINEILDQLDLLWGNDIDLKEIGASKVSEWHQLHFVELPKCEVHPSGPAARIAIVSGNCWQFMEIKCDSLVFRNLNGDICECWSYDSIDDIILTSSKRIRMLKIVRNIDGNSTALLFRVRQAKYVYCMIKEMVEKGT